MNGAASDTNIWWPARRRVSGDHQGGDRLARYLLRSSITVAGSFGIVQAANKEVLLRKVRQRWLMRSLLCSGAAGDAAADKEARLQRSSVRRVSGDRQGGDRLARSLLLFFN